MFWPLDSPAEYRWSSYQTNAQGKESKIITPHESYLAIDTNKEALQNAYRCLFENQLDNDDIHTIREASQFSMPLGSERFNQQIEAALARSIGYSKRGRPMIKEDTALYCDYDVMEYWIILAIYRCKWLSIVTDPFIPNRIVWWYGKTFIFTIKAGREASG